MNKIIHDILQKPLDEVTNEDGTIIHERVEEMIELMSHYPFEEFELEMGLIKDLCEDKLNYHDGKVKADKSPTFGGLRLVEDKNE